MTETDAPDLLLRLAREQLDMPGARRLAARVMRLTRAAQAADPTPPRSYPGYPGVPLPPVHPRAAPGLDEVLRARRCQRPLGGPQPPPRALARLLRGAHGAQDAAGRGPTPSAGGLQALELYLVPLAPGWLAPGAYHYDRVGHRLAHLADRPGDAAAWRARVAGLDLAGDPPLLVLVVADTARVQPRYGPRGARLVTLEAGHLMQNLCLVATSMGWSMVPMGGLLEEDAARALGLPATDVVLYAGALGQGPDSQPSAPASPP